MNTLISTMDRSVNFVRPQGQEARYVRRTDDYAIVYLSVAAGCPMACRHCWLTQTGQTASEESSLAEMLAQADQVLKHYTHMITTGVETPVQTIHFNWMARGEPMSSGVIHRQWRELSESLIARADQAGVPRTRLNISTIMPTDMPSELGFDGVQPVIFYSLYSVDPAFRRRWLPRALPAEEALRRLARWQRNNAGEIVLHWAFIEGENDSSAAVARALDAVQRHGIKARFNLVRYNPFSEQQGREPSLEILQERLDQISASMTVPGSRIVPRVGFDVKASCGMFVAP